MSRSWFYLTLWHGTPEDFTTRADVEIQEHNFALAIIEKTDTIESKIADTLKLSSNVQEQENFTEKISMATEVLWYVN